MTKLRTTAIFCAFALSACAPSYSLVPPASLKVAKNMIRVQPSTAWNRTPPAPTDIKWEEKWTQNGPLLDEIGFIGGLPEGESIAKQRKKDDRKVPVFRADMSPQDLVSMIESFYRIKTNAAVFEATAVEPISFLGRPGLRFDYVYVGGDEVKRKGRSVLAVVDRKLYLMSLDGAALHYFDAALPEFDAMAASAALG